MKIVLTTENIGEALQDAARSREPVPSGGYGVSVKDGALQGFAEIDPAKFDATQIADACKAWLLKKPRNMVAMGTIEFYLKDDEPHGAVDVEPKPKRPRKAKGA